MSVGTEGTKMIQHSNTAIAIQLFNNESDKHKVHYENLSIMTIVAMRTIREIGYDCDIVVITNIDDNKQRFEEEGAIVEKREMFEYPALYDYKCGAWGLSLFDIQKVYYWSLYDYDKVLAIDNDMTAKALFTNWEIPELLANKGRESHLNSGMLLLEPSEETYHNMRNILKDATFSPETGWNNCGKLKNVPNWEFQAANAAQGFLMYYFDDKLKYYPLRDYFEHYVGKRKFLDQDYQNLIKKHGFKLHIPKRFQDVAT